MKRYHAMMLGCALCVLSPAVAQADCKTELAAFEAGQVPNTGGIAKDGSMAPLQDPSAPTTQSNSGSPPATENKGPGQAPNASGGIAKDGSTAPLAAAPSQAMSGQDAQAQQEGRGTAAQTAQSSANDAIAEDADRARAIAEAKAALLAGNEEACLAALQKVSGS